MELRVLLLADYANVAEQKKLNVMGVFGQIYADQFPAQHPEMYLILQLVANPSEYNTTRRVTVQLLDEDAREHLVDWAQEIQFGEGKSGRRLEHNIILRMANVVFPHAGAYQFSVLVDNDHKGDLRLDVVSGRPEA